MTENPKSDMEILQTSEEMAYVGGGYYNPVCELEERGRKICGSSLEDIEVKEQMHLEPYLDDTFFIATLLDALTQRLEENELLFGLYESDKFRMAAYIHSPERLIEFERQVLQSLLKRRGYYGVDHDQANKGLMRDFQPR